MMTRSQRANNYRVFSFAISFENDIGRRMKFKKEVLILGMASKKTHKLIMCRDTVF
jgi:hypothetical protein